MDLSTQYLGLKLKSPLIPSACQVLTGHIDNVKRLEDAGSGAIVLHSLFEEQLEMEEKEIFEQHTVHDDSFSEANTFMPYAATTGFLTGPDEYLKYIHKVKQTVHIPVIASLNGTTLGGWTSFAKEIEKAGADAIELNIYGMTTSFVIDAATIEQRYLNVIESVRKSVKIPMAVKLSPFFTNLAYFIKQVDELGVQGIVLFNRFYQPDIDIENRAIKPNILLSSSVEMRLPLRWIAILYGRIQADLAATSGVQKAEDVIKMLMAGAKVTMLCSALLRYGISYMIKIEEVLRIWLEDNGFHSIQEFQGCMSQINCEDPAFFERVQYIRALHRFRVDR